MNYVFYYLNYSNIVFFLFLSTGRESIPSSPSSTPQKEVSPNLTEYLTLSIPVTENESHISNMKLAQGASNTFTTHVPSSITVETNSFSDESNNKDICINPAKSVLRPRSGKEYVVVRRIPIPESLPDAVSASADILSSHSHTSSPSPTPNLRHMQTLSSCASLSACSIHQTPQRSPSLSSTFETVQSNTSLSHQVWEIDPNRLSLSSIHLHHHHHHHHHGKSPALTPSSSSPSQSPKTPSSVSTHHASPKHRVSLRSVSHSTLPEEESIFFPLNITFQSSSNILPPCTHRHCKDMHLHQPIYVNQQIVDMHYSQSQSSEGSHKCASSNAFNCSPVRHYIHSNRGFLHQDTPCLSPKDSHTNSLGRRNRYRHSESNANLPVASRHSKSSTLPTNHHHQPSDSRPFSVHRSHSDPKRGGHVKGRQMNIHGKEFDKFAKSAIISRRRMAHPAAVAEVDQSELDRVDGAEETNQNDSIPNTRASMTSSGSSHLQIPTGRTSSGYKNLDGFGGSLCTVASTSLSSVGSHSGHLLESQTNHINLNGHFNPNSPPPLPARQRVISSPPQSPFPGAFSDVSDSPPPYNAPPPPSDQYLTPSSSSSEDEPELNYIEVDMSSVTSESERPRLPISSRRNKRARQRKKEVKFNYVEIDHRATKALQDTGQQHAKSRRSGGFPNHSGSSLSRINSAPISKKSKPVVVRERKLSTGSIESF